MSLISARQKNVQRFVFNALQWITKESRLDHGVPTPDSMHVKGAPEDMNVENSWMDTHDTNKHKQHSDTDCSAIFKCRKGTPEQDFFPHGGAQYEQIFVIPDQLSTMANKSLCVCVQEIPNHV